MSGRENRKVFEMGRRRKVSQEDLRVGATRERARKTVRENAHARKKGKEKKEEDFVPLRKAN